MRKRTGGRKAETGVRVRDISAKEAEARSTKTKSPKNQSLRNGMESALTELKNPKNARDRVQDIGTDTKNHPLLWKI